MITQGHPRVVVVMRRGGGGKSLLFMLPAAASKGGLTIAIVPKRALQANMRQRCIDAGIKCAVWSDDWAPPYDARILFAIAESAVTKTFADFIDSRSSTQRLERMMIDECHTIMQSTDTWRPNVRELRALAGFSTQVVCLTATLPPTKQAEFMPAMDSAEVLAAPAISVGQPPVHHLPSTCQGAARRSSHEPLRAHWAPQTATLSADATSL